MFIKLTTWLIDLSKPAGQSPTIGFYNTQYIIAFGPLKSEQNLPHNSYIHIMNGSNCDDGGPLGDLISVEETPQEILKAIANAT